ncbi:MAG: hypothetical protein HYT37_02320 [Candidatus Sungbacteria bacterium]|nr:hypothetical protein [Candidatus Sungbacteria bacterium]
MSTKNLARTVIEGGRYGYSKFERSFFNRAERRQAREILQAVRKSPDSAEESMMPIRQKIYVDQNDKTNPVERWLRAHCGKKWNDVHAKIFRTFETRTIAGQHIYDHMLGQVATRYEPSWQFRVFLIDEDGVLNNQPYKKTKWQKGFSEYKHIRAWLNGRYIGRRNSSLFWFLPVKMVFWNRGPRLFGFQQKYRQGRRLSLVEENIFFGMSRKARNELFEEGSFYIPNLVA